MKNSIYIICLILFISAFFSSSLVAQELPPSFGGGVNDTVDGPISGLVFLGVVIGSLIGYKKLKK